jgi:hypothetical protein
LILTILIFSFSSFAADKKNMTVAKSIIKTAESGILDINPKDKTEDITDKTLTLTDKDIIKAEVTCKTKDGKEFKDGDAGYKDCLEKSKAELEVKFKK